MNRKKMSSVLPSRDDKILSPRLKKSTEKVVFLFHVVCFPIEGFQNPLAPTKMKLPSWDLFGRPFSHRGIVNSSRAEGTQALPSDKVICPIRSKPGIVTNTTEILIFSVVFVYHLGIN
jgi:hypothetical protein